MKPLAIDLCCGFGGWTEGLLRAGFRVIGFDIVTPSSFPAGAQFVLQDIRTICGVRWRGRVALIVASTPCTEFSQVWNFVKHRTPDPASGVELVHAAQRIAREAEAPLVLENVAGAQRYIGKSVRHVGPYHLLGDVPFLLPRGTFYKGCWNTDKNAHNERRWHAGGAWRASSYQRDPARRALIPPELAGAIANYYAALFSEVR